MAYPKTLPLIAGLSIVGAAGGVWLGRSAIAEIDPAYYSSPADRFHADQVPYRSPEWAQVQAADYQQQGLVEGLGTGCMGCGAQSGDIVYAAPAVAGYGDAWTAGAAAQAEPVAPAAAPAPDPDLERVLRYASYAVSSEEAARAAAQAALAEEESEPEAYASVERGTD